MNISFSIFSREDIDHALTMISALDRAMFAAETVVDAADTVEAAEPTADPRVGVELDSNGVPWIEAVHAGTKSQTKEGRWTKKRGVEQDVVDAAEAEAKAKLAGTPEPDEQPEVEVEQTTVPPVDYRAVTEKYVELLKAGLIDEIKMMDIYAKVGTTGQELATNETHRAAVYAELCALADAPVQSGLPL